MFSCKKDLEFVEGFDEYLAKVKRRVKRNQNSISGMKSLFERQINEGAPLVRTGFRSDGAIWVTDRKLISNTNTHFWSRPGRTHTSSIDGRIILRGPRYLAAINPAFSANQILDALIEDFTDAIFVLSREETADKGSRSPDIAGVLDYAKNSLITLLNTFLHKEKIPGYDHMSEDRESMRAELIQSCSVITKYFYSYAFEQSIDKPSNEALRHSLETAFVAANYLRNDYAQYKLSGRAIVRPESSHPLTIYRFACLLRDKLKRVDQIFALPSGSTEIGMVVQKSALRRFA